LERVKESVEERVKKRIINSHVVIKRTGSIPAALGPRNEKAHALYSNQGQFETPGPVVERPAGSVDFREIDGGVSHGPLHIISVNLRPMEIQILGK
jgi:hypothetical protein